MITQMLSKLITKFQQNQSTSQDNSFDVKDALSKAGKQLEGDKTNKVRI